MVYSKYKNYFIAVLLVFFLGLGIAFLPVLLDKRDLPENVSQIAFLDKEEAVGRIRLETFYKDCGHTQSVILPLKVYRDQELFDFNLDDEGISLKELPGNDVLLSIEVLGLCPEDEEKRHVRAVGDVLMVFYGPIGSQSRLARVTTILVQDLPEVVQERLENGGIEFPSEESLQQAFDSLEEYDFQ